MGNGTTTTISSFGQIGTLTTWSTIGGGNQYSIVTKTDGTIWSWGYSADGQLGLGDIDQRSSPVQIGSATTWFDVATGGDSSVGMALSS